MEQSPRLIPVLDILRGVAVHAVGGDRASYQPLRSCLHPDSDPLGIARGIRERLGLRELYLADLDAIAGAAPNIDLYRAISALDLPLWIDAGIRDRKSLAPLLSPWPGAGNEPAPFTIIAGLETVQGPEALATMVDEVGPDRLVFSLDLRAGRPLIEGRREAWGSDDPCTIARTACRSGARRILVLDLARVGTGRGIGPATRAILAQLRAGYPELEISVGGGIASRSELHDLAQAGADAVLVGSALHDGRIETESLPDRRGQATDVPSGSSTRPEPTVRSFPRPRPG